MSLALQVGIINYTPSKLSYDDFIAAENSILANSGYQAIKLEGQAITNPDNYPVAKAVLGVDSIGNLNIPDMQGKTVIGSGSNTDKNGETKLFTSGTIAIDSEFSHQLVGTEMSHFHVVGGRKDNSRAAFFAQGQVTPVRDLTGMTEYDDDLVKFSDLIFQEPAVFGTLVDADARKFVTTLNDNDPDVLTSRELHNNIQPSMGAHAWMIIDDPS